MKRNNSVETKRAFESSVHVIVTAALGSALWSCSGTVVLGFDSDSVDPNNPAAGTSTSGTGSGGGTGTPGGLLSCHDGQRNAQETDVDCGGPACGPCDVTLKCGAGSDCATGACENARCVLASGPPFWLPGIPMTRPRGQLTAATQQLAHHKGKIVAVGGYQSGDDSASTPTTYEVFDPATGIWSAGNLPQRDMVGAVAGPEGKVYIFDGYKHVSHVFDGVWSQVAPPPSGCALGASGALAPDNLIYVICDNDRQLPPNPLMTYDAGLDRWASLGDLPSVSVGHSVVSMGSRIYWHWAEGGNDATFAAYDIESRVWSRLTAVPGWLGSPLAAGPDGRIYMVAGYILEPPIYHDVAKVYAYEPKTDSWSAVAPLASERHGHAVVVGPDGRIYTLGGYRTFPSLDVVEVYGPAVSLLSSRISAGSSVDVNGNNFAANAKVTVRLGSTSGAVLAGGETSAIGSLGGPITFNTANLPRGDHELVVMDDKSRFPITLGLTIE